MLEIIIKNIYKNQVKKTEHYQYNFKTRFIEEL